MMQGFFSICKSISVIYHINKLKNKKIDHLNRCRKSFRQNSANIYDKHSLKKNGLKGNLPQHNESHKKNHIQNYSQWWKDISSKMRSKPRISTLAISIQHNFGSASHGNQRKKRNEIYPIGKKGVKSSMFAYDVTLYIENFKSC